MSDKERLITSKDKDSDVGINKYYSKLSSDEVGEVKKEASFRDTFWRWVALFFACFFLLGSYFCYDNPNALSDMLQKYVSVGDVKYNLLYSVYSYPNVILPLIGGVLIDKIGINFSIVLFSILLVAGQGVFAIAGFVGESGEDHVSTAFIIAIIGRVVFGLGGESLNVCQSTVVSRWFKGKELSLALGINISVSRLGSVFNNYTMPPLADATSLGWALTFGFILCIVSFACGIVLTFFERHANKVDKKSGALNEDEKEEFHWRDIKEFTLPFWLISANCVFTYIGIFCFNNISNDFFVARYGIEQKSAARITSIVFFIPAFLAPAFGIVTDRIGHKVTLCIIATSTLTLCHALFFLIPASNDQNISYWGIAPVVLLGVTYSIYVSALWPMVPMVVEARVLGSAYGLCTALQNIGLAIGPTIVGALTFKKSTDDEQTSGINNNAFNYVSIALGGFALLGVLSSIALLIADRIQLNGKLQKPDNDGENEEENGHNQENEDHVEDMDSHSHGQNSESYKAHVKRSIARSSMAR
ncbi:unnamed protein product [Moneuplotes crassus]|uniref:Lysosomal dipeptide transporter MFSD1 n=1 Tax=Euplotes crassus TaxID=5936 RepID=A0AAD1X9Y6_EUPCR|nr:unnamed protein product [Moneuplotes crassus]